MGLDQRVILNAYAKPENDMDSILPDLENHTVVVKHSFIISTMCNNRILVDFSCDWEEVGIREWKFDIENLEDMFEGLYEDDGELNEDYDTEDVNQIKELLKKLKNGEELALDNDKIERYEFIYECW